jgi:electron transport complex protein RnfD
MLQVTYALIPGIVAYIYFFGWGVITNLTIAIVVAYLCEALMLIARRRAPMPFLSDGSALVTALLFALALPPYSPWWLIAVGIAFAMIFAKHLYGGLGYNPFNPAMVGYAMLLISFPKEMTTWPAPQLLIEQSLGFSETLHVVLNGGLAAAANFDALSMATPLDFVKTETGLNKTITEIVASQPIFSHIAGLGWEWINIAFLAGGAWLIYRCIISWHIPVAMLGSLSLIACVFYFIDPEHYASPLFHLFSGAAMLGAFFIATDPVTASTTRTGKLIYAACIGLLVYVIRTWGGYPDAVAFSVLLVNMLAPTIDYYTQPRVYGQGRNS